MGGSHLIGGELRERRSLEEKPRRRRAQGEAGSEGVGSEEAGSERRGLRERPQKRRAQGEAGHRRAASEAVGSGRGGV